jgi:hypothetical protein
MTIDTLKEKVLDWDRRHTKGRFWLLKNAPSYQAYRKVIRMTERPVLIGGCGRSGTTLLLSLVSVFRRIYAIPKETCSFCWAHYPNGPEPPPVFHICRIYRHLLAEDLTNKTHRWAEKTPKNVHSVGRLLKYFGEGLRFINIVRDGRDVVTSRHPSEEKRYWVSPERWIEDVSAGRKYEGHDQVLTIQYEDLTADYMSVMETVADFLDEPFDQDEFSRYPETSSLQSSDAWFKDAQDVHSKSVRRWEEPEHREIVDQLLNMPDARRLLRHYDYIE